MYIIIKMHITMASGTWDTKYKFGERHSRKLDIMGNGKVKDNFKRVRFQGILTRGIMLLGNSITQSMKI